MMRRAHIFILVLFSVLEAADVNFTWLRRAGDVHTCLHGSAVFPWHYNTTQFPGIANVYWRGPPNFLTMYAIDVNDGVVTVKDYPSDRYSNRVSRMADDQHANLGLVLSNVTTQDTGPYRIEVGGYINGMDKADLTVHTVSTLRPTLVVDNQPDQEFGQTLNKSRHGTSTLTISTASSRLRADISITHQYLTKPIVCPNSSVCTLILQFDEINAPLVNVQFKMNYNICEPHDLAISILTGRDFLTTVPPVFATESGEPEAPFPLWLIIIVLCSVILLGLLIYLLLGFVWFRYKNRERKGKILKRKQRNFLDSPCLGVPMTAIYSCKHGRAEDIKKDTQPAKEVTPLMDRKNPSPVLQLTENGNIIFKNLARAKNLSPDTIEILLADDYDTEEALVCMEENDLSEMGIQDDQKEALKAWIEELRSRTTRSGDSHTISNTNDSSTMQSVSSNGEFSIEDCLRNLQMSEKNKREVSDYVLQHGVLGLESLLRDKLKAYMGSPVNIAVTGRSGTGKSSLINTLRGLRARDKDAAKVGVTETTFEMQPYHHPDIKNVVFWDLPGVNTPNFPRASYLKDVEFKRYDAFIIAATERLTQDDIWLAKEANSLETPFYFLRTKIDTDVANNRRDGDGNERKLLEQIRSDICVHLAKDGLPGDRVFLISNILKNKRKWDFPKLVRDLVSRTPERNKFAMVMAMVTCSKEIIMLKKDDLQTRITTVGLTAALSGGNHEDILKQEVALYMECFGVRSTDLVDIDFNKLDTRLGDIKSMLDAIVSKPVEESVKGREVGKWFLGIGYFVGMIVDDAINKVRRTEFERHVEESTVLSRQIATDAIVEEAVQLLRIVLDRCEELALAVLEQKQYL